MSAESSARVSAVASLQGQLSNILSNSDPAQIDSLSEVVNALNAGDGTLTSALATLQSSFDDLKDRVDELTSQ